MSFSTLWNLVWWPWILISINQGGPFADCDRPSKSIRIRVTLQVTCTFLAWIKIHCQHLTTIFRKINNLFNTLRYCSEKFKDPAPMGTGNSDVVNFTEETILKWIIWPLSSRDNVSMLRSYKLFDKKNLYRLCGADCLDSLRTSRNAGKSRVKLNMVVTTLRRTLRTGSYGFRTVSLWTWLSFSLSLKKPKKSNLWVTPNHVNIATKYLNTRPDSSCIESNSNSCTKCKFHVVCLYSCIQLINDQGILSESYKVIRF